MNMRLAIALAATCLAFPGGLSAAPARATDPPKPAAPTPGPGAEAATGAVTAPRAGGARPMRAGTRTGFPRANDNPKANAGEALLRALGARLAGHTNLAAAGVVRETVGAGEAENVQVVPFAVTLASGGRQLEEYGDSTYRARVVSDGRMQWTWLAGLGQYTRYRGAGPVLDSLAAHHREQQPPGGVSGIVCAPVAGAALGLVSAVPLREDTLHAADRVVRCDVVAATYASPHPGDTALVRRELWIAKDDGLAWRHGFRSEQRIGETGQILHRSQFVTFSRIALDGTPADSLFAFRAPAGSREVLAFEAPGRGGANLTGRPAPPFALRDLDGREHGLDALAGKVVLLDFWASWCGPCRMTMPALDRLTREFADRGLVVYSVNLREKPQVAAGYMKKFGYSMTTLLDPDGSTAQRYGVSAIPVMIVIGRDGQVVAHLTGAHGEATMRAALERAGIQ